MATKKATSYSRGDGQQNESPDANPISYGELLVTEETIPQDRAEVKKNSAEHFSKGTRDGFSVPFS